MMKIRSGLKTGKVVGETVKKMCQATGLDRCAEKYAQATGKDCGCAKRKAILDILFPW